MKLLATAFVICLTASLRAAIVPAATGSTSDVQAAHDAASAGDTVLIPDGTFVWSSPLNVTKAITLAGSGATIIQDNGATTGTSDEKCIIYVQVPASGVVRISNIDFEDAAASKSGTADGGVILVSNTYDHAYAGRAVIEDCTFTQLEQSFFYIRINGAYGVTARCAFDTGGSSRFSHLISHGNGASWGEATDLGTDKFWIVEDCTYVKTGNPYEFVDSDRGGRFVVRHNTLTNSRVHWHGADSGTNQRGTRAFEIYENSISSNNSSTPMFNVRAGTGIIAHNTITNYNVAGNLANLKVFRITNDFGWGYANGANTWDANDGANPYVSGTATSGGTLTMTDSGASWTPNQWDGYVLRNTTTGISAPIASNTPTEITFLAAIAGYSDPNLSFSAMDGYEINRVIKALDMPGLGEGTMTNAFTPATTDSAVEPIYLWGNTVNGSSNNSAGGDDPLVENTHYYVGTEHPTWTAYEYPHPLVVVGATYTGRLRFDGTGSQPVLTDQTGSVPIKTD